MDLRGPLIEATKKLAALRAEIDELQYRSSEPIAVVSVACRLPGGVDGPDGYWRMLEEGRDAIEPFPSERWNAADLYDPDPEAKGKTYCTQGGFVRGMDRFDPSFFGIAPREAEAMDPAQRIVLECVWEALERAGIPPATLLHSNTGVYFGAVGSDYEPWGGRLGMEGMDGYGFTGRDSSVLSGRVAYTLGLQGPAMTVNTACSSSLVAIHLACRALRSGECNLALCGGAQVMTTPASFVEFSRLRGMAPDGRCKSFADGANGTGWSEGCGVLVLERLSDALRADHRILSLVRGTAVNQDGRSQGLTAPNGPAQERVIRRALDESALTSADIDAIEGHGTGTSLGDPIEINALASVFGPGRPKDRPLYIGSSKSNIGHTQAAAGVAAVIKMALALTQQKLPRSLHARTPSRHVSWAESGLAILDEARDWPRGSRVRRAGVSSFGVCGTNAHVVLEEAPATEPRSGDSERNARDLTRASMPLLVSGVDEAALREQAIRLADHLERRPDSSILDVAFSLATTRTHFPARLAMSVRLDGSAASVASSLRAAAAAAAAPAGGAEARIHARSVEHRPGKLVMLFSGQGSQRPEMGRELYAKFPIFRESLEAVCAELDAKIARPLLQVMFGPPGGEEAGLLDQTAYAQPALFALEVALYRLWESWGLVPDLLVGHSVGELAAAHVAGVLSLGDACTLVAARGRLMQQAPPGGAMFAVHASHGQVAELLAGLEDRLAIAAINGPQQTVISGDEAAAEAIVRQLQEQGRKVQRLLVSHAFHSPHMNGVLEPYRQVAGALEYHKPKIAMVSSLTGKPFSGEHACTAEYWVRQVRGAVRFGDAVATAESSGADCYIECGPQDTLSTMAASCVKGQANSFIPSLTARDGSGEEDALVEALARVHVAARTLDWNRVFSGLGARRVELPTYAFQRQRYWLDAAGRPDSEVEGAGLHRVRHALLGAASSLPDGGHLFTGRLSASSVPWLRDHSVFDQLVVPGMCLAEMMLTAGRRVGAPELGSLTLEVPLIVPPSGAVAVQVWVDAPGADQRRSFRIHARAHGEDSWTLHASGVLQGETSPTERSSLPVWPPPDATLVDVAGLYERLRARGLSYGAAFRCLREVRRRGTHVHARVVLPTEASTDGYAIHPALADAALHALLAVGSDDDSVVRIPFAVEGLRLAPATLPPRELRVHIVPDTMDASGTMSSASVHFHDSNGALIATAKSIVFRRIYRPTPQTDRELDTPKSLASVTDSKSVPQPGAAALYRVAWTPKSFSQRERAARSPAVSYAVVGASPMASVVVSALRGAGHGVLRCDDALELRERLRQDAADVSVVVRVLGPSPSTNLADEALRVTVAMAAELEEWVQQPGTAARRYVLVTAGAVATSAGGLEAPAHAPLWGLLRSVVREHPSRSWMLIDTDGSEASHGVLAAALLTGDEPEMALRRGNGLVPRLMRADTSAPGASFPLDPDGTVLVTGGTSGLGAAVAKHLATRHGARHLLLVSRQGSVAPGALELTKHLADVGCTATLAACDVADRAALEKLLDGIPAAHPLESVFHCAAVLDDGLLASLSSASIARVFAPKVKGAVHLHELTKHLGLSAFVLFSSIAGIVGNEGQGSYGAANTFLDALSAARRQLGLTAHSLAWGPWSDVGMVARLSQRHQEQLRRGGFLFMDPEEALEQMDRALQHPEALLVPMQLDEDALHRQPTSALMRGLVPDGQLASPPEASAITERTVGAPREAPSLRQRLDDAALEDRAEMLLTLVTTEVAAVLKLADPARLHPEKGLEELGMDSLMAVDIRRRLEHRLSMQLPPTLVFDHPSGGALVNYMLRCWDIESPPSSLGERAPDEESAPSGPAEGETVLEGTPLRQRPDETPLHERAIP